MKKILFSVAGLMAVLSANAQIKNDRGTFSKPVAGNVLVEMQVTPNTLGGGVFNLNDPMLVNLSSGLSTSDLITKTGSSQDFANLTSVVPSLKGRYFLTDMSAIRAQVGMIISSASTKSSGTPSTTGSISRNGFDLVLGYEKHFSGAERLSTYAGADVMFGMIGAKAKNDNGTTTLTGKQSAIGFGARGVVGFDYYFIPKVYLGAELGLGLSYNSYGVEKLSGGALANGTVKSGSFAVTPFITPAFRLGFNF